MPVLTSPGVAVTVEDRSAYVAPAPTTVPLFIVATRENKSVPDQDGVLALGTTGESGGTLRVVTSQRELLQTYGIPSFVTQDGEPVHDDETNEYGLLAAHSFLGQGNRAFILRADIDLGELVARAEPIMAPPDGTYWFRIQDSNYGLYKPDSGNPGKWTNANDESSDVFIITTITLSEANARVGDVGDFGFHFPSGDATQIGTIVRKVVGSGETAETGMWEEVPAARIVLDAESTTFVAINEKTGAGENNLVTNKDLLYAPNLARSAWDIRKYNMVLQEFIPVSPTEIKSSVEAPSGQGINDIWEDLTPGVASWGGQIQFKRKDTSGEGEDKYDALEADKALFSNVDPEGIPQDGTTWFGEYPDNDYDFALYRYNGSNWVSISRTQGQSSVGNTQMMFASFTPGGSEGAIWIDVSTPENIDNFPVIHEYDGESSEWVPITNSVHISSEPPFRPTNGTYWLNLGADKTRNTVKRYNSDWTAKTIDNDGMVALDEGNHWEPVSGDKFGRRAVREAIVEAMQAALQNNQDIRSEATYFQLIAAPGYPELYDEMLNLNSDNEDTAFIIADTPKFMRVSGVAQGREVGATDWVNNNKGAQETGEKGFTSSRSPYAAFYYPWGLATNLDGESVMVPPSHIALRVIANSDENSFPWKPPAGFQRGLVTNAASVGRLTDANNYEVVNLTQGQQDILYERDISINPIVNKTNQGLVVFGQRTFSASATALDRINVARLVVRMKYELKRLLERFLFEINDSSTRRSAQVSVERYMSGLRAQGAMYDYAVRCDGTNNTPAIIDQNQLFVEVAFSPAKAIEFIYVPLTIENTGEV